MTRLIKPETMLTQDVFDVNLMTFKDIRLTLIQRNVFLFELDMLTSIQRYGLYWADELKWRLNETNNFKSYQGKYHFDESIQ